MNILIKFPTRGRPTRFFETLNAYYEMLNNISNVKFLITCDVDDHSMNSEEVKSKLKSYTNLEIIYGPNKTKIEAINYGVPVEDFDIILLASDDMVPIIKGYDDIIINAMDRFFPDKDGVLWFNDGLQGKNLNTLCILGKKYYDRFGYIYYPEYKSLYCDNEFTEISMKLGKCVYIDTIIIKHFHYSVFPNLIDDLYIKNDNYLNEDKLLWDKRSQLI